MRGREFQQEDHFNLLPFIAILMCVLGTELLVTMSMASLSVGVSAREGWMPAANPNPSKKAPVLAEWDGEILLIHRGATRERMSVRLGGDTMPPALDGFLVEMSRRRDQAYVLFAVRPTGFLNYYLLAELFRKQGITIGIEPIEQDKSIRLVNEGGTP